MLSQILRTVNEQSLLRPGDRVLVGLSGGPDSTALLAALQLLAPRLRVEVAAAVVDHGLRPESSTEAALVAGRCRDAGIACQVLTVDVHARHARHVSWQDAARRARLEALEGVARSEGFAHVALGHTLNDQAETVLFRIVRGTGLAGLAGIPYRRAPFIRPLLDVSRASVLRFVAKRHLVVVTDPSNTDGRFARARVRGDWLPFLARENPRIVDALVLLASEARRLPHAKAGILASQDIVAATGLSRRAARTVDRLATAGAGSHRVSVHGGELEIEYGNVRWSPRSTSLTTSLAAPAGGGPVTVAGPGVYDLRGGHGPSLANLASDPSATALHLSVVSSDTPLPIGAAALALPPTPWPFFLRAIAPGDRMRPLGGRGSRKLQDLLVDAKIPRARRARLPVLLAADGTILFVPGLRAAEAGRPTRDAASYVQVRPV